MTAPQEVSQLLRAWSEGDRTAFDQLMPIVYQELRHMAGRYMDRQQAGHTLQTTALIHEVYLRLIDCRQEVPWQNRAHFFGVAATAMRHILVDYARTRQAAKRGGGVFQIPLDEAAIRGEERTADLVALDDALQALAQIAHRKSQVVELRYFGGLTVDETAEVLKVSPETVARDWRLARSWLLRELSQSATSSGDEA
jgi:RNA polymerase sigma-70 factor, ECF subfamily